MFAILTWSALPGASRHHWGTDIDVFDKQKVESSGQKFELVTGEYESDGPCSALAHWLEDNIQNFGFSLPYASYTGGVAREPWHLSYRAIADQIEAFLKSGNKIDVIESGISGQPTLGANKSANPRAS